MSLELVKLHRAVKGTQEQTELKKYLSVLECQFIPNLDLLQSLFQKLPPAEFAAADEQIVTVELQHKLALYNNNIGAEQFDADARAYVTFRKFIDNGRSTWIYIGPVKQ